MPEGRVCFGTGAGGSLVIADADRRMTIAYVMNTMAMGGIVWPVAAALSTCTTSFIVKPRAVQTAFGPERGGSIHGGERDPGEMSCGPVCRLEVSLLV